MRRGSATYALLVFVVGCFGALVLIATAISVAQLLGINFLVALLIIVLSLYFVSRIPRRFWPRTLDVAIKKLDIRDFTGISSESYVKAAQAKQLADRRAAKQPAVNDFQEALEDRRSGIALIRPYPPRNLPSARSRIGGLPDLPDAITWPRVAQEADRRVKQGGYPLHFLAQLDLSELPKTNSCLPKSGTLLFFAHLDEELGWSGSKNSVRVLYDSQSSGQKTRFPSDITPVYDGTNDFQDIFGIGDDLSQTILPEWPLIATTIETIPGPAFSGSDALYSALLRQRSLLETDYLISQLNGKVATQFTSKLVDFSELGWTTRSAKDNRTFASTLAFEEVFCHLRICELIVRRIINLIQRKEQISSKLIADGMILLEEILSSKRDAKAFHVQLNAWFNEVISDQIHRVDFSRVLREVLLHFVAECGSDSIDTSHVHEKIFTFAAAAHVLQRAEWGMSSSEDDESIAFFHQSLGHVWTAQGKPQESDENICLLHLKSDFGLGLLICDVGGIQFWINPSDLEAKNFSNVWATTQGY